MILILTLLVGLGMAGWNAWHRLGRSRRARAWSHSMSPEAARHVLVVYPLFAAAAVFGSLVGLAPDGPLVMVAAPLFLAAGLTGLAYVILPLPVPSFVKPQWYAEQERGKGGARA